MSYDNWISTDPTDAEPDWDGTRDDKAAEAGAEEEAANDFKVTVEVLRSQMELYQRASRHQARSVSSLLLMWVADVIARGPRLAADQWLADFIAQYGEPTTLRACAEAIGQQQAGTPRPEAA
jgi:hypothetical protein